MFVVQYIQIHVVLTTLFFLRDSYRMNLYASSSKRGSYIKFCFSALYYCKKEK